MLTAMSAMSADTTKEFNTANANAYADQSPPTDYYRSGELSLDAFGTGSIGKYTLNHLSTQRIRERGKLGAGLGINYFITRNLGLSGEIYSENTSGVFIDNASANLTLRFPLGQTGLAPYVFGGGGRQFDRLESWFGQGGGGLEWRFTPHIGIFADARLVIPDEARYYGLGRLGLRFAF